MQYMGSGINAFTNTLNALTNIHAQQLRNKMAQLKLNDLPQMLQIAREEAMAKQNVLPQQLQANLAKELAGTAYTQAQAPYLQAQTQRLQELTKEMPEQLRISQQKSKQDAYRSGPIFQLRAYLNTLSPTERANFRAQNPELANQLTTSLLSEAASQLGIGQPQPQTQPQTPIQLQPTQSTAPAQGMIPQQGQQKMPQMQQPMQLPKIQPNMQQQLSPQAAQAQRVAQLVVNQSLTTPATRRQVEGAQQVDAFINSDLFNNQVEDAAKFVGIAGKGKAALAAASQTNPKEYENYLSFKNDTMPLLLGKIKILEAYGATDSQRAELHGLYAKALNAFTSNPAQFKTQIKNLKNALEEVGKAVQQSSQPVYKTSRTLPQQQSFQIPSNPTKEWYDSLTPEQKWQYADSHRRSQNA